MADMRITDGTATVTRHEDCDGKPVRWEKASDGVPFCLDCGKTAEHANHDIRYKYEDDERLQLARPDGSTIGLSAKDAYRYMSGDAELKTIAAELGVEQPYTLRHGSLS